MKNKIFILKILLIVLLLFMVFCSGSQNTMPVNFIERTSEDALMPYLSSGALNHIPSNAAYVMKINSINEIYDSFEFEYIEQLLGEEEAKGIRENMGFLPFNRNEFSEYTGVNIENPVVVALVYINEKDLEENPLSEKDIAVIISVPYNNEEKVKTEIIKEEKIIEKTVGDMTVYTDEINTSSFFFSEDYMTINIMPGLIEMPSFDNIKMPEFDEEGNIITDDDTADEEAEAEKRNAENEEILLQATEKIINLSLEKSLAKSYEYKEHMLNSDRRSIMNNYVHYERFMPITKLFNGMFGVLSQFAGSRNNAFGANPFTSFDTSKILYSVTDTYFTSTSIECTYYNEYKDGESENLNKDMLVSDFIKNLPGDLTTLFYFNNGDVFDKDTINAIIENYQIPEEGRKEIEQVVGMDLEEFLNIFKFEAGGNVANFETFPKMDFSYYLGLNDVPKMEKVINNVNNHIIENLKMQIKERNGRYIINAGGMFMITYGIVGDKLLICSNEEYFNKVVAGKENTAKKVNSGKLKSALNSKGIQGLFHLDFDSLFDILLTLPFIQSTEELKTYVEESKKIFDEMNIVSYNTETATEGVFEMKFETKGFMKKIYKLAYDLFSAKALPSGATSEMKASIQHLFDTVIK